MLFRCVRNEGNRVHNTVSYYCYVQQYLELNSRSREDNSGLLRDKLSYPGLMFCNEYINRIS